MIIQKCSDKNNSTLFWNNSEENLRVLIINKRKLKNYS